MGNRVVREGILDSDMVDKLTWPAEVFYRRLMSMLDDYGRCDGRVSIMRSKLYPLRLNKVSDADVVKWLTECVDAGLVSIYHVEKKPYLQLFKFRQTVRIKREKFPAPQMQADASRCMPESNPNPESEIETESESESVDLDLWPTFEHFWEAYGKKVDKHKCEKKWRKISQEAREKIMFHVPEYVKTTPDLKYRRDPTTYLNNESWENEIITTVTNGKFTKQSAGDKFAEAARIIEGRNGAR